MKSDDSYTVINHGDFDYSVSAKVDGDWYVNMRVVSRVTLAMLLSGRATVFTEEDTGESFVLVSDVKQVLRERNLEDPIDDLDDAIGDWQAEWEEMKQ